MTLQFREARVWPLKIALIGTWWQPPLYRTLAGLQHLHTYTEESSLAELWYTHESVALTCFKDAQVKKYGVWGKQTHTHTPYPTCRFMTVTENPALCLSHKHDSLRLMKASHDTLSYESAQWRKDAMPIRNMRHYFFCKLPNKNH